MSNLVATLTRDASFSLVLYLHSTRNPQRLGSAKFKDDSTNHPQRTQRSIDRSLVIFDPADEPQFVFVLVAQQNETIEQAIPGETGNIASTPSAGVVQVWEFSLSTSLTQKKSFRVSGAGWISNTIVQGYFSPYLQKISCCDQRRKQGWCKLWLMDVNVESWTSQLLIPYRHLSYVPGKESIVAMTEKGWIQSKSLADIQSDISKYGNGRTHFISGTDAPWVLSGWKKLALLPPSFIPCSESGMAAHENGEVAVWVDLTSD